MKILILLSLVFCLHCSTPEQKKEMDAPKKIEETKPANEGLSNASEPENLLGITEEHNIVRKTTNSSLANFVWDSKLAEYARLKVDFLAQKNKCKMDHNAGPKNPGFGENLFWGKGTDFSAGDAVKSWADEKAFYNYSKNSCKSGKICGHYTQIVWKDTKKVGCAKAVCPGDQGQIIGCNYDPPVNYIGEKPY
ncbi:MAG: pathogenesis-related family 1 protein [Leptospiraceae bacterium]|nr:pathogenesis-related family 1 protein [Leptospiraceae bacterium]